MSDVQFALYVSSVEGHAVVRLSSHKGRRPLLIGATRDHEDPTKITWHTDRIIAIPEAEYARFGREYNREIRGRGLKRRTAEEYAAWVGEQVKAEHPRVVAGTVEMMNGMPGPGTQISDGQLPGAPPIPPAIYAGEQVVS